MRHMVTRSSDNVSHQPEGGSDRNTLHAGAGGTYRAATARMATEEDEKEHEDHDEDIGPFGAIWGAS